MATLTALKNQINRELQNLGFDLQTSYSGNTIEVCNVRLENGIIQNLVFTSNEKCPKIQGIKFYTNGFLLENSFNQLMYILSQPGYKYDRNTNRYIKH